MEEQHTTLISPVPLSKQNTQRRFVWYLGFLALSSLIVSSLLGMLAAALVVKHWGNSSQTITRTKLVDQQSAITAAVRNTDPAVVSIVVSAAAQQDFWGGSSGTQEIGAGSGFIVSNDGYIVTNKHVASNTTYRYQVELLNGKQYAAQLVYQDPINDLAILKISAPNLTSLSLGDSHGLQLGATVIAIGNALGQYQNTIDVGVVSGIGRSVTVSGENNYGNETLKDAIQTDAQINSGNSGGPLLNIAGQVVGVNTAIASNAQGIGFALPVDQVKTDIAKVKGGNFSQS